MQLEVNSNNQSKHLPLSDGVKGNKETIYQMINLTVNTVNNDKGFNDEVRTYFTNKGYNPYNDDSQILSQVFNFIKSHVKYIPDKAGEIESISDARETLKLGFGDCDDLSILTASILGVLGFENVNFIYAQFPADTHVYTEVITRQNKRYAFDLSLPNAQFGQELKPKYKESFPVFHQSLKEKMAGVFIGAKHNLKQAAKQGLNTIPYVVQFLPLGIVSGNLLLQGVNLLTSSDISKMSLSELGKEILRELDNIETLVISRQIADQMAKQSVMQISAQLGTYQVKENEQQAFSTLKDLVKEKAKIIYGLIDSTPELNLNAKGMAVVGLAVVGFVGYRLYTRKSLF